MNRRKWLFRLGGLLVILCGVLLFVWWFTRPTYTKPTLSFDGSSDQLQHTVIVPTLDTPIPEGKNAIWCASFQIAWNKLKSDVAKGPMQIKGAEAIAERLNKSPVTEADLPDGSHYAAAGLVKDGVVERIQREMAERFPNVRKPEFISLVPNPVIVAYGYLNAGIKFTHPFRQQQDRFEFRDSNGQPSHLVSFGTRGWKPVAPDDIPMHEQVEVLMVDRPKGSDEPVPSAFALDLCKASRPNQLILAVLPRGRTLGEALEYVAAGRATYQPRKLWAGSHVQVPDLDWTIDHRYRELETNTSLLLGAAELFPIGTAQHIRFQLNRSGVRVESDTKVAVAAGGDVHYDFNRPFLIILKKRDAANPFFVMWVDNAELLQKWGE
jgi:hypothetical protein